MLCNIATDVVITNLAFEWLSTRFSSMRQRPLGTRVQASVNVVSPFTMLSSFSIVGAPIWTSSFTSASMRCDEPKPEMTGSGELICNETESCHCKRKPAGHGQRIRTLAM